MSNLPFAGIKLEIVAIPTAVGSYRYEVYAQPSTSRSDLGPLYMTPCSTFDSVGDICKRVLAILEATCARFIATNTALPPPNESPAKPYSNPLLSENSGIA